MDDKIDIGKIAKDLKKVKNVEAVYLFGSFAKGRQKPYSDLDICVITNDKISERRKAEILSSSSKKIDISIFSDLPLYIQYRVFKEGKPLYVKNPREIQRIKYITLKRYLDFKPRLEKYQKRILRL